jgi:hypothetical protein
MGWTNDSSHLYVLIVQDLDGESAGNRQKKSDANQQTGGMSLPQLQQHWAHLGVPNAIILDGGDSTQLACSRPNGGECILPSGYLASRTIGYLNQRPIRVFIPFLPPAQNRVGVMNYLYLTTK